MPNEVDLLAAQTLDQQRKAETPALTIPPNHTQADFIVPNLPSGEFFVLRNLTTLEEHGPFRQEDFTEDPTTGFLTAHTEDGTPIILRTIYSEQRQHLSLQCVDADGEKETYVIRILPDNNLEELEP